MLDENDTVCVCVCAFLFLWTRCFLFPEIILSTNDRETMVKLCAAELEK